MDNDFAFTFNPWRRVGEHVEPAAPLAGGAAPTRYRILERRATRTHRREETTAFVMEHGHWARVRHHVLDEKGYVQPAYEVPGIEVLEGDKPLRDDLPDVRVANVVSSTEHRGQRGYVRPVRPWTAPPARLAPWVTVHSFVGNEPCLPDADALTPDQEHALASLAEPRGGHLHGRARPSGKPGGDGTPVDLSGEGAVVHDFLSRGGWGMERSGPTWRRVGRPRSRSLPPPAALLRELGFDQDMFRRFVRKGRKTQAQREGRAWIALRINIVTGRYRGHGINEALATTLGCSVDTVETLVAEGRWAREMAG